jgi:hypothetical protein
MIYKIIQPDASATTYNLSDGTYTQILSVEGTGMPSIQRLTRAYPNADAHRDFGFSLQARLLTLKLFYQVATAALADLRRDAIYKIFRPFDAAMKLTITRDTGDIRQIDVHTVNANDLAQTERVGDSQIFSVTLLAPNPIWYDPTPTTKTITPSTSSWNDTITYLGNCWEYPVVKIYGQVSNFTMAVITSFGTVNFNIPTIPTSHIWTFDGRLGYKTIKNQTNAGQLNNVNTSTLNALYNFKLAPTNFISGGVHSFNGTYTAKDANHKIEIIYYNRFWGI